MKATLQMKGIYDFHFKNEKTGAVRSYTHQENMITNAGLATVAQFLADGTGAGQINYIAVGDGNTAVAGTQTQLINETDRKVLASANTNGAIYYGSVYFGLNEANGAIKEVGAFMNADNTPNSGVMFSRISEEDNELPLTKQDTESLTIDYSVSITSI